MSTFFAKKEEQKPRWFIIDADGQVLGKIAVRAANILRGKVKVTYTPHVDTGDGVIVVNAAKVVLTGKKWQQKEYAWYTGYPGQHRETAAKRRQRRPELILREAVRRMLPKNKLAFKTLTKLKIYAGSEHPHQAQLPELKELGIK